MPKQIRIKSTLLISFLSLLIFGCFGRTAPSVKDTKQYYLSFNLIQSGGMNLIDPLSARCIERTYRFNEKFVGGMNDAKIVEIEKCNHLIGWTDDYDDVSVYWENLRIYLGNQKADIEKRRK